MSWSDNMFKGSATMCEPPCRRFLWEWDLLWSLDGVQLGRTKGSAEVRNAGVRLAIESEEQPPGVHKD